MSYVWPDHLQKLRAYLDAQGVDTSALKTERQAGYFAQKLLNTRFHFPKDRSASMFKIMQGLQNAIPAVPVKAESMPVSQQARSKKPEKRDLFGVVPKPHHVFDHDSVSKGLVIFCDGACEPNPGYGGWGFVVYLDGKEIHADCGGAENVTNNIMEMTAALKALQWFAGRGVVEPVRLLCDSQYTVKGCNEWRHKWARLGWKRKGANASPEKQELKNVELWMELHSALTLVPITLEWVKGHIGTIGNERADELATIGRQQVVKFVEENRPDLIAQQLRYEIEREPAE